MRHIAGIRLDAAALHRFKPIPEEFLTELIAAANSIPEGAPVGTIARRPDGKNIALRVSDGERPYWVYLYGKHWDTADSWPVIYDPREYEGTEYDPETGLHWFKPGEEPLVPRPDPTAQQEPVIRGTVQDALRPDDVELLETDPMEFVRRTQQEPAERRAYLGPYEEPEEFTDGYTVDALFKERAKYWNRNDPATTHPVSPESTNCVPKPRTPRVVDRLGVDEQGSRWLDKVGDKWWFSSLGGWRYQSHLDGIAGTGDPLDAYAPYVELIEPRVLPSLDCEEARDGTEWETVEELPSGGRCSYQYRPWAREWWGRSPNERRDGHPGYPFVDEVKVVGPFREVLGDPS